MDSQKELFSLPKDFPLNVFTTCGSTDAVPLLHWHECLELNYVKSGTSINIISDIRYNVKPGEVYIINNSEHHYAFSDGSLELLVIIFDPVLIWTNNTFDYDYLKPFFERRINFCNLIEVANPFSIQIGRIMLEIEKEYQEKTHGYQLIIKASLMKILALLYRHFKLEDQISNEVISRQQAFERIKQAVLYIDSHYTTDIKLENLAKIAYMNPTYFSSCFKKVMHFGITEYVNALRINHASRLLKQTSKSITEICSESGFNSLPHFNRAFKNVMKIAPSQYRLI